MTQGEWKSRVECAAGHHLLELYHLTDMVEGVLGVRMEDEPGRSLNYSSVAQADGVLRRRPDINCILHTHIPAATIRWFDDWITRSDPGIKQRILEYNEDDCVATRVVLDKLRRL